MFYFCPDVSFLIRTGSHLRLIWHNDGRFTLRRFSELKIIPFFLHKRICDQLRPCGPAKSALISPSFLSFPSLLLVRALLRDAETNLWGAMKKRAPVQVWSRIFLSLSGSQSHRFRGENMTGGNGFLQLWLKFEALRFKLPADDFGLCQRSQFSRPQAIN